MRASGRGVGARGQAAWSSHQAEHIIAQSRRQKEGWMHVGPIRVRMVASTRWTCGDLCAQEASIGRYAKLQPGDERSTGENKTKGPNKERGKKENRVEESRLEQVR